MKPLLKIISLAVLTTLFITGCSSTPPAPHKKNPYNQPDVQRNRAHQAQGDLSSETSR